MLPIYLLLGLLILGMGALAFYLHSQLMYLNVNRGRDQELFQSLKDDISKNHGQSKEELELKLHALSALLQKSQTDTSQTLQEQFKQNSAIIREVTQNLTRLQETNKQVVGFAEQIKSLESALKSPKQRGILGEFALETLLANTLHGNYSMQHKMKNGEIVDAVIFFNDRTVPIDSKFSLENFNKMTAEPDVERRKEMEKLFKSDVKKRIDETAKYIRPEEGTTEFAFMFIPAEGIYYALTGESTNVLEYAFKQRVILVSPSSFFAYLQTVVQGLKALEMGKDVQKILEGVEVLGRHVEAYDEHFKKLGKHLETTVNSYNFAGRELRKMDKDVYKLSSGNVGGTIELLEVEKPATE